ncbi:hypothetical protein QBC35DRAFT_276509 [Podospora australis]|uniref:Uncharacterized protein n=1 Tax=Podospora australis TaxID=1536484 RepID=A0AAN7ANE9_9PEZI|nr:hypothetical protein QBC35DRAFT_276509 [Podospora australis]
MQQKCTCGPCSSSRPRPREAGQGKKKKKKKAKRSSSVGRDRYRPTVCDEGRTPPRMDAIFFFHVEPGDMWRKLTVRTSGNLDGRGRRVSMFWFGVLLCVCSYGEGDKISMLAKLFAAHLFEAEYGLKSKEKKKQNRVGFQQGSKLHTGSQDACLAIHAFRGPTTDIAEGTGLLTAFGSWSDNTPGGGAKSIQILACQAMPSSLSAPHM